MSLINFLKQQGFIEDSRPDNIKPDGTDNTSTSSKTIAPTYFPVEVEATSPDKTGSTDDPSFVAPLGKRKTADDSVDPTFVKFFEDELTKSNLPGPDYFEFRQQLLKTQQKMSAKGMAAPEVVLQAVLMSFDAQGVSTDKLIEAARHYKDVIKQKNDDFLKGAESERNNQLQKRQTALQVHTDAIQKLQEQIQQLDQQKQQIEQSMNKEKTQLEVDKTLGKEGIEKIERAERLITTAHEYMQSTIDADIKKLKSV
jgi:uncharacterized UPF0160 family protein